MVCFLQKPFNVDAFIQCLADALKTDGASSEG